ncbi:MAG: rhomboid family intramembrane serine protease [Phaeodactylibacter sp.]|nr:rhomboid family intramembrane serine protease [Phaeodactylibacter sp.]
MLRVTDVVRHLLIINVLMFVGTMFMGDWERLRWLAMFYPTSEFFMPTQIVTHMFMHANFSHLFFNMFGLYMFGPPLESLWGPKRFLFYYLFTGLGALALHLFVSYLEINGYFGSGGQLLVDVPMLGASGAIFGLLAGFGMRFPNVQIMLLFPPIPMKAKYFVLIYAAAELMLGLSGLSQGVAHFAHVGGALFGVLLILYWDKFGNSRYLR